jgi:dihydrofolate reductase
VKAAWPAVRTKIKKRHPLPQVVPQQAGLGSGPLVIGHIDHAARRDGSASPPRDIGLSHSEELGTEICSMAKLVYGLNQSLDGYVDHMKLGPPAAAAFRHFLEHVRDVAGNLYGRRMYEVMRYWDEDVPDWDADERDFAVAWRSQPKWVVSRSLKSVGPNANLVADDLEALIRRLKAELDGEIDVGGPDLARSLTEAGLIDEYRLYLRPVVLGGGTPFFAGPRPPLHLVASDLIADDLIRLTYVPA